MQPGCCQQRWAPAHAVPAALPSARTQLLWELLPLLKLLTLSCSCHVASYFFLTPQTTNSPRAGNRGSVPNATKINKLPPRKGLPSVLLHLGLLGRVSRGGARPTHFLSADVALLTRDKLTWAFVPRRNLEMNMYTLSPWALAGCMQFPKCWQDPRLSGSPKLALQRQTRQTPQPQPLCLHPREAVSNPQGQTAAATNYS